MIEAKNICKKFSEPVLKGISLKMDTGEIIGIAGKNASGKSTLLSILAGFLAPDEGEIKAEGNIGWVPQENALFDNLSVKDNLMFWAAAFNLPGGKWQEVMHLLPEGNDFLKKRVIHLSGGMKKRLSIALACLNKPEYLIMDEPTAALDIGFKQQLAGLLRDIRSEGKSVIFTSHQPDELLWCDRIYILKDGVFSYEGDPKKLEDISNALYYYG